MFEVPPLQHLLLLQLLHSVAFGPDSFILFNSSIIDVMNKVGILPHDSFPGIDSDEVALTSAECSYKHVAPLFKL